MNPSDIEQQNDTAPRERRHDRAARRQDEGNGAVTGTHRVLGVDRLGQVARNLGAQLDEQVHKRPYVILGTTAALGFVAGSVLGSRFGQLVLALGLGYVARNILGGEIDVGALGAEVGKLGSEGTD
jgi:ElaB/YqjD/DUF883 family membrane-anchored ribosome-binding protein